MSNKLSTQKMSVNRVRVIAFLVAFIALLGSFGYTAVGQTRRAPVNNLTQQTGNESASVMFRSGRDLITDGQWAKAQEKFDQYVTAYPNERNVDVALYWMAYAEYKLAKFDLCKKTIERLLEKYPNTSWRDDARILLAQIPGVYTGQAATAVELYTRGAATAVDLTEAMKASRDVYEAAQVSVGLPPMAPIAITPSLAPAPAIAAQNMALIDEYRYGTSSNDDSDDPCEFKIVVLQALFQTDLQRGIMAATEWLKPGSTQTVRCKSAALSLLGRNGGKAVTPVILGFARSEPDVRLRARAISALGATNDDSVIDSLRDFALSSQDPQIVEASLSALSRHTGDRAIAVLADIAVSGKVISQRKVAISSIASRPGEPAVDALLKIYDADQTPEIRRAVIAGFGNRKSERAGTKLFDIARSSDNVELRKASISAISRRGGDKAVEFLLSLYDTEKNEEVRDQIVSALGVGNIIYMPSPVSGRRPGQATTIAGVPSGRAEDPRVIQKLIEIAKNPQAPMERRKRAIGYLSRSKDPQVLKFLEELLNQ